MSGLEISSRNSVWMLILVLSNCSWERRTCNSRCICFLWPFMFRIMIRSTYVRLVWIANEFTQVCLNADFGLVKLQMGITDDHDQLRLFSLASFVLYEDKIHIAGVCLVWKYLHSMVSQCWFWYAALESENEVTNCAQRESGWWKCITRAFSSSRNLIGSCPGYSRRNFPLKRFTVLHRRFPTM